MINETKENLPSRIKSIFLLLCSFFIITQFSINSHSQGIGGLSEDFSVIVNKSRVIAMRKEIRKVSMGNPSIADIVILKGSQIYILGKSLGTTNVQLWDKSNNLVKVLDIEVTHDLYQIKRKLHELLPDEEFEVFSSNKSVVLKGQVSSLVNMGKAITVAESFAVTSGEDESGDGKVINLLNIGGSQQGMLKVTVAELERSTIKKMGIKWFASDVDGDWSYGGASGGLQSLLPPALAIEDKGLFASLSRGDLLFNIALEAAKNDGTAKILAEPTVIALSGEKASFLSGGEFPIPVPQEFGINTIEFKEYGIAVEFIPTVLSSGAINLDLSVNVSELSTTGASSFGNDFIPALTRRSTSTTVELADGQSIGLAGLISENMRGNVNKFPGLGDIPVLGQLFRSEEFVKGESELVIMVTPVLVTPLSQPLTNLPTDSFVEPSDIDFYILGTIHGRVPDKPTEEAESSSPQKMDSTQPLDTEVTPYSGGVDGQFGHGIE